MATLTDREKFSKPISCFEYFFLILLPSRSYNTEVVLCVRTIAFLQSQHQTLHGVLQRIQTHRRILRADRIAHGAGHIQHDNHINAGGIGNTGGGKLDIGNAGLEKAFTSGNAGLVDLNRAGIITFDSYLAEGTIDDALEVIPGYTESGSNFMSHTNGIPSMKLGDALYFRVYAKLSDGTYAYSPTAAYHAVAYAKDILANSTNEKMKALVVAMLNYGAAAQVHFDHNADNLMNAFRTDEQKALVNEYSSDMVDSIVAADSSKTGNFKAVSGGYSALAPSVVFEGAFSINYYFTPAKAMDGELKLYYWKMDDYNAADVLTTENATGVVVMEETSVAGQYLGAVPEIAAKQIDQTVYVCGVYGSDGVTYNTGIIAYSLGAYCLDRISKGTETMKAFAAETIVYGYYAKTYFANL